MFIFDVQAQKSIVDKNCFFELLFSESKMRKYYKTPKKKSTASRKSNPMKLVIRSTRQNIPAVQLFKMKKTDRQREREGRYSVTKVGK